MALALPLTLPRMMVLSKDSIGCVRYVDESEVSWDSEGSVFDPLAKIVVEKPKSDDTPNLVHLRFGYSNRYWALGSADWIVANSKDPEEHKSNPACTLFYLAPFPSTLNPWFSIQHLQSGGFVNISSSNSRLYVDPTPSRVYVDRTPSRIITQWLYQDWETLVKMPAHVAFKRDNGKYLTALPQESYPYLYFSSDDPNEAGSGFQVQLHPRGYLRIKSDYFNKFWRRNSNCWILADSDETFGDNEDTLFWPVRLDDSTIALRNKGNDNFCKPLSRNCLNAAFETITKEARLGVLELAQDRKVYNVKYQMEDARIHDQKPYLAGKTTAINNGDEEAQIGVTVTYEDQRSHSFSRSLSITAGVSVSIEADVLGIVRGRLESSFSVTGKFEWGDTTTTTNTVQATGSVTVPARSKAVVSYVGTQGTCDVPFHYSQEYTSTTDGCIYRGDEVDGIFTGVNCYDFDFQFDDIFNLDFQFDDIFNLSDDL